MTKGPSEAEFQRMVLNLAKLCGWRSAHFRAGMNRRGQWQTAVQGDGAGFPDLLLVHAKHGRVVAAELKVAGRKVTPEQQAWLDAFRVCGIEAVVWRPENWNAIEAELMNKTNNQGR